MIFGQTKIDNSEHKLKKKIDYRKHKEHREIDKTVKKIRKIVRKECKLYKSEKNCNNVYFCSLCENTPEFCVDLPYTTTTSIGVIGTFNKIKLK